MIQIAQDIFSSVQCKKRRRSGLRRGFLMQQLKKQTSKLFKLIIYSFLGRLLSNAVLTNIL